MRYLQNWDANIMSEVSIKKNFAYKSTLTVSTYLMNFVTFPYVARVLGVDGIGLVSFVDNAINYFLLFATMGVATLGVREIAIIRNDEKKRNDIFANILGLNLLFTIGTLFIYLFCILSIDKFQQYEELFYIGSAKILFTVFLVEWFFTGIENFRYIAIRSILIKVLYVISVFALVHDKNDYQIYFSLNVLVVVINAIINMIYVRKIVRIRIRNLFKLHFLKQNISLGIYAIMTSMYLTFNVMFLGLTSGNIEVGFYTTAFKLYSVILGFFTAFTNVMLPRMSFLLGEGDNKLFQQLINKSFDAMCSFSIPMMLCSIALAPQIIYVLSGSGYEGAILPMRIIMPAILFVGIAQVIAMQVLMPMRKDKVLFMASLIGAIVSILINIFLVPRMQSIGTAIVLICSELMVTLVYIVYTLRHTLLILPYKIILINIFHSLPCVLICYLCGKFIENDFTALLVAMFVSLLYWGGVQIKACTVVGIILKKKLIKKIPF